jgi:glutaredoxin
VGNSSRFVDRRSLACIAPLLALVALPAAAPGCGTPAMTPAQIDHIQRTCSEHLDRVRQTRSDDVRFAEHRAPPGTPVVVYGTSWCHACGATAAYLERRRIPFVEKDIEDDDGAAAERVATLKDAGLPPSSAIPVINVRGTVTEGFYPCVVEAAWADPP